MAWLCTCGQQNFLDGLTCLACDGPAPVEGAAPDASVAQTSNRFRADELEAPAKRNRFRDDELATEAVASVGGPVEEPFQAMGPHASVADNDGWLAVLPSSEAQDLTEDDAAVAGFDAVVDSHVGATATFGASIAETEAEAKDEDAETSNRLWPDFERRRATNDRRGNSDRRAEWPAPVSGLPEGWPSPFAGDPAEDEEPVAALPELPAPFVDEAGSDEDQSTPAPDALSAWNFDDEPASQSVRPEAMPASWDFDDDSDGFDTTSFGQAPAPAPTGYSGYELDFEDIRLPNGIEAELGDDRNQPVANNAPVNQPPSFGALSGGNHVTAAWNLPSLPGGRPAGATNDHPHDDFDDEEDDEFDFDDPYTPAPPGETYGQSSQMFDDASDLDEPDEFELEDDDWALPEEEPRRRPQPRKAPASNKNKNNRPRSNAKARTNKKSGSAKPGVIDVEALKEHKSKILIAVVALTAIFFLSILASDIENLPLGGSPINDQSSCFAENGSPVTNRGDLQRAMVQPAGWSAFADQVAGTGKVDIERALAAEPDQSLALSNLDKYRFVDGFDRTFQDATGTQAHVSLYEMAGASCASGYANQRSSVPAGARPIDVPGSSGHVNGNAFTVVTVKGPRVAIVSGTLGGAGSSLGGVTDLVEAQSDLLARDRTPGS